MLDRRQSVRDRVILGSVASINDHGSTMDCVVRNMSEGGACVEFEETAKLPDEMRVTIAQKGCSFFRTRITGREGHSSAPDRGVSAISAAIERTCSYPVIIRKVGARP